MTTQLPRPIEPGEIKAGMKVRRTITVDDDEHIVAFTAAVERDGGWESSGHRWYDADVRGATWTLLAEAPTPAPKSWREQLAHEIRKWADGYHDVPGYWRGHIAGLRQAASFIENSRFGESIPDIPDHSDGCSPWLWDEETRTAWVAGISTGGVTHVQVFGEPTRLGYLSSRYSGDQDIVARLRPYSERGQANG